jgi:hypothetical protein
MLCCGMNPELCDQSMSWQEGHRLRAWELHKQRWKQTAIMESLGLTLGAVNQWSKRGRDGGREALHH